jgi:hypothetical protein
MNDHELDDQMRLLAQSYNEPPATPREAMWERIEGARRRATPIVLGTSARMRGLRMGAGIAAVLVVGIGIGRLSRGAGRAAPGAAVAAAPHAVGDAGTGQPFARAASDAESTANRRQPPAALASTAQGTEPANPVRATRDERLRALREQRSATSPALTAYGVGRSGQGVVGEGSEVSAYRLAVIEHMARTEVLLTSFLAESRNGSTGTPAAAQFASLSRDLLKTTRLLLATRTADDPALTRLLEDLELVLMQISQYTAEGRRGDLDAINQSLDRRNVLPKLRSTIPAGASASAGL